MLDYAEVKALAVGDERIRERVETANEITRLTALQMKTRAEKLRLLQELDTLPGQIASYQTQLANARADAARYAAWKESQCIPVTAKEKEDAAAMRRALRGRMFTALQENVLCRNETVLCGYAGFQVTLPANMMREKPYLWMKGQGRYYVEVGSSEAGILIRLDNFLDAFPTRVENLEHAVWSLEKREADIRRELNGIADYGDEIESLMKKLNEIDNALGVKQK